MLKEINTTVNIKLGKNLVTFNLSFDKYQWRMTNPENFGIIMSGYFDNGKPWCTDSVRDITFFYEELKERTYKVFKREYKKLS
jgi:hypothetical protein